MKADASISSATAPRLEVENDGSLKTPSFVLPFSTLASNEARGAFVTRMRMPDMPMASDINLIRQRIDQFVFLRWF